MARGARCAPTLTPTPAHSSSTGSATGDTGSDSDQRSADCSPPRGRPNAKRRRLTAGIESCNVLPAVQQDLARVHSGSLDVEELRRRFTSFFLAKAMDIIGEGTYRRFILKHKNAGEEWAMRMHCDVQYVQQLFRAVVKQVQLLQGNPLALKLFTLCQRAMHDTHPPVHCSDGWRLCALTGQRTEKTVCLGALSKADAAFVHQKFFRFFSTLWLTCRMETCVRNLTHCWLKQHPQHAASCDYQSLAHSFRADAAFHDRVARCFCHSAVHVARSIHAHTEQLADGQHAVIGSVQ
jgi:hypothetical protein